MENGKLKYEKTNRDWVNGMALIDFLDMLNNNAPSGVCIMELLTGREDYECPEEFKAIFANVGTGEYNLIQFAKCYECISKWLNEKH